MLDRFFKNLIRLFIIAFGPFFSFFLIKNTKVLLIILLKIVFLVIISVSIYLKFKTKIDMNDWFKTLFIVSVLFLWYEIFRYCNKKDWNMK
jgi:hypothetical protein